MYFASSYKLLLRDVRMSNHPQELFLVPQQDKQLGEDGTQLGVVW